MSEMNIFSQPLNEIFDIILGNTDVLISLILMIVVPLIVLHIVLTAVHQINEHVLDFSSIKTFDRILTYFTYIVIFVGILDIFGFSLRSFVVSLGLVSVAVSLAARDTLSNIISGIILLVEGKFKKEDIIEIDGQKGQVVNIGFKSVTLKTSNELKVIPNILFTTKAFVNYTTNGFYMVPFNINFRNSYDINERIDKIRDILSDCDLVLDEPESKIYVKDITTAGVELQIKVPIDNPLDDSKVVSQLLIKFKDEMLFEDLNV